MVDRRQGAIINVSSVLSFSASAPATAPLPKRVVYAACKAYITAFSELLYHELEGTGVQVQALCPGIVRDTEFHGLVAGFDPSRLEGVTVDAQQIVQASLVGLELGEVICVPGLDDPALVDRIGEVQRQLAARAGRGSLAERYRE
jgi:short-subunit dehydrogenase